MVRQHFLLFKMETCLSLMVTRKENKNEIATTDRTVVPFHLIFNKNEKEKLE